MHKHDAASSEIQRVAVLGDVMALAYLLSSFTSPLYLMVVPLRARRTGSRALPQKIKGAAVTRSSRTAAEKASTRSPRRSGKEVKASSKTVS